MQPAYGTMCMKMLMLNDDYLLSKRLSRPSGFTIVELLIVIVIIAILATITVVAYNGIQVRASNTQTIHTVSEYVKALSIYAADKGDYPATSGCLGEGYPGSPPRCLSQSGLSACFGTGSSQGMGMNVALKPYMGNLPEPSMQAAVCGGTTYIGAYAAYVSASRTVVVLMILRGNQDCPPMSPNSSAPGKVHSEDTTRCAYTLASIS